MTLAASFNSYRRFTRHDAYRKAAAREFSMFVTYKPLPWSRKLRFLAKPLFVPAVIAIGLSIVFHRRIVPLENTCAKCGYSLVGNVSGRCPECGSEASTVQNQVS
jgi:hypothetical protein